MLTSRTPQSEKNEEKKIESVVLSNSISIEKDEKKSLPSHRYIHVTPALAKENKEYWKVVENMFRESSTRIWQKKWREKHGKVFQGKYKETLVEPLSLKFIKEPMSPLNAIDYAEKINKGKQTELNFNAPDFVRDIYKALRLNLISRNQLMDILLLRGLEEQFNGKVKRHHFEDKAPLNLEKISYATPENIKNFKEQLEIVPDSERCYFSINIPRPQLLAFLFIGLTWPNDEPFESAFSTLYPFFLVVFEKYIIQKEMPDIEKESILKTIRDLADVGLCPQARIKLILFLIENEKEHLEVMTMMSDLEIDNSERGLNIKGKYNPTKKESANIRFLISLLRVGEDIPALEVSPDYNANDSTSPVICFNLLSMSVFQKLQDAIFGKEDAVYPFFSAGQFGLCFIRYLDEKPIKYGIKQPSRPVEIIHPDMIRSETFHDFDAFDFMGSWHDIFHAWKCSANTFKPCLRYLTALETNETGFDMSKSIAKVVDRELQIANKLRLYLKEGDDKGAAKEVRLNAQKLLLILGFEQYMEPCKDSNLLFIVDMIIHQKKWTEMLSIHPREASVEAWGFKLFQKVYDEMEKLINEDHQKTGKYKSIKFYIVMYHLLRVDPANRLKICNKLNEIGVEKNIYWKKNKGLYFQRELKKSSNDPEILALIKYVDPILFYEDLILKEKLLNKQAIKSNQSSSELKIYPQENSLKRLSAAPTVVAASAPAVVKTLPVSEVKNAKMLGQFGIHKTSGKASESTLNDAAKKIESEVSLQSCCRFL